MPDSLVLDLDDLDDECLSTIASFLPLEDLVAFGRASRRLFDVVQTKSHTAWLGLYREHFPGRTPPQEALLGSWYEAFRDRYKLKGVKLRMQRRTQVMGAESDLQVLKRDERRLARALATAVEKEGCLARELGALRGAGAAAAALQCWQPVAVAQHHQRVVRQQPAQAEWRLRELQELQRDSVVYVQSLQRSLRQRGQQVDAQRRRVRLLKGL